ncbi:MAG TPA: hypothetical protein VHZ02_13755 [Acidimicrobiales bacterium]|nr:hypothetical protein [Acidimicrobiales bacterium]
MSVETAFEVGDLGVGAFRAEESDAEEREQRIVEALLVQVHTGRVVGRDVL